MLEDVVVEVNRGAPMPPPDERKLLATKVSQRVEVHAPAVSVTVKQTVYEAADA
jgi:hypothetical protein